MTPAAHAVISCGTWGFVVAFLGCALLVLTTPLHGWLSLDSDQGVQKSHVLPTTRVGGLPLFLGLGAAWLNASGEVRGILWVLLVGGAPAFAFGLVEDLSKSTGVSVRLLATMASGVLACVIADVSLTGVGVWGVDALLRVKLISVLFSAFALSGVANAINLIDGFNGLAALAVMLALAGLGAIALEVGDSQLAIASFTLALTTMGFFWMNWPQGRIFLGDGGAYFIGFSLAWLCILLVERNNSVSPFAGLLICAYPITETLFSVWRRWARNQRTGQPDHLHFHSLLKRRYVRRWLPGLTSTQRNSVAGLLVGGLTLVPAVLAQFTYTSSSWSMAAYAAIAAGYVALYARMCRFHWCSPLVFLFTPRKALRVVRDHGSAG